MDASRTEPSRGVAARAVYDRALLGALGGLIGWLLYGIFGDAAAADDGAIRERVIAGAVLGGAIGYMVAGGPAWLQRLRLRGARQAAWGLVLGAISGALGFWLAPRWGWVAVGTGVGLSDGMAARASRLSVHGGIGGAVAGLLPGLFMPEAEPAGWRPALSLLLAGASVGAGIAAAEHILWPAQVLVLRGPGAGRRYPLFGKRDWLDLQLGDRPLLTRIDRQGDRYILTSVSPRPEDVRLNGEPVSTPRDLKNGDRLQLGATELEFHARHSRARRARDPEPPTLDAVAPHPFAAEPFAGVTTLRELAGRMQSAPSTAAPLLETGAVARWCAQNGWAYPVRAATAPGLAVVQQFFEAVGLAKPPVVELEPSEAQFTCIYPERLLCTALLRSPTRKWVFAEATSGVAWLKVVTPRPAGVGQATVEYELDSGLLPPGSEHQGELYLAANAGQQRVLSVRVTVHRPHEPFTRRVLRPLLTGALGGLLVRLLLAVPDDLSARLLPENWGAVPEQAYARRFVLACWWWGLPFVAYWCWRQQRLWREWAAYLVAAAGAGLAISATAACLVPLIDTPPRVAWRVVAEAAAWSADPPGWPVLWLATAAAWWATLGAVLTLLARIAPRRPLK